MEEITTMNIFGLTMHHPVTVFTDLMVSAVCYTAFFKLRKLGNGKKVIVLFRIYFLVMGIATTLGGIMGHGFIHLVPFAWKLPGWVTSMIAIMFIERAVIEHTRIVLKPGIISILNTLNIIELMIFMSLTFYYLDFFFVEFHSGYGLMFVVLSLQTFLFIKTRNPASKKLLIAVGLAAIAAIFFMTKPHLWKWFRYIDVSHLFMALSAYYFFQGAIKISQTESQVLNNQNYSTQIATNQDNTRSTIKEVNPDL
ncbi:MAG: hypothetical protein U0W24_16815 [Bacteroidales bacterium]